MVSWKKILRPPRYMSFRKSSRDLGYYHVIDIIHVTKTLPQTTGASIFKD